MFDRATSDPYAPKETKSALPRPQPRISVIQSIRVAFCFVSIQFSSPTFATGIIFYMKSAFSRLMMETN
ncbi:hypothetical protein L1987_07003 [Smallanthus sonchifolius]|uniref:Uncharacterized protein n=1 Tax=Smallanthus sonchifolius TaxID=185202 RepID=A0ACB9JZW8_9ASTR|nr:hypothetical protein L1987_07003 [Smallanthus sonchifolius]